MDLLVLGESLRHPRYRGTERDCPYYVDSLPKTHPANRAFLWYVNNQEGDDASGIVHDLAKARALIEEYAKLAPAQGFELVEMTCDDAEPELGGELLGYDVTELYYTSILAAHLPFDPDRHERGIQCDESYRAIAPFVRLFKEYFSTHLNEHVLFTDRAMAEFCCDCAATLIQLYPDVFDMPKESLRVVGLYLVP